MGFTRLQRVRSGYFMLLPLLSLTLANCDSDDDSSPTLTVSGIQNTTLTVPAGATVTVEGNLEFADGLDPALVIEGNAVFRMQEQAAFNWPVSVDRSAGLLHIETVADDVYFQRLNLPAIEEFTLEGIRIRNAQIGVYTEGGGHVILEDIEVENCLQYGIYASNVDSLEVVGCTLEATGDYGLHIKFSNTRVERSQITGALTGLYCLEGHVEIQDTEFHSNSLNGLFLDGSDMNAVVEHCLFDGNGVGIYHYSNRFLTFRFNKLQNQTDYSINFPYPRTEEILLEQNDILPGGDGAEYVQIRTGLYNANRLRHLIASNNWWGTTDSTLVRSGITDGYQHADTDTVRIYPMLNQAVSGAGPRTQ